MLLGPLLGLATAVIWGTGDFLSRKPSEEIGSILSSILIQPIGLAIMLLILFLSPTQNYVDIILSHPFYFAINLALGGVVFLGIVFLFRGYSSGVMSVVAPIGGAYPIIAVSLSVLLLGTVLTPIRSFAIFTTIIGILLTGVRLSTLRGVLRKSMKKEIVIVIVERKKIIEGADYGIATLICAGFGLFGLGVVASVLGSILAVVVLKFAETIAAFLMFLAISKKLVRPSRQTLVWLFIIGACDAVGFATYNIGVLAAGSDLPIVVTLSSLLGVVTVTLARVFYKERLEKIQILGVVIIFAAVAILLYF